MIAFVSASPSVDRLIEVDEVRVGEIHRRGASSPSPAARGSTPRAPRTRSALGPSAVALLGGHAGNWIAQELRAEGVAVEVVEGPGESRVSLSVAPHGGGALTEFYEPAPEVDEGIWAALELAVERAARDARWVAISGSLPPGAPDEAYRRLADAARRAGARVALDARDAGLRRRPARAAGLRQGQRGRGGRARPLDRGRAARRGGRRRRGRRRSRTAPTGWSWRCPTAASCARRRPRSAATRSEAATPRSAASSPRWTSAAPGRPALSMASGAAAANAEQPGAGRLDGARAHELALAVRPS